MGEKCAVHLGKRFTLQAAPLGFQDGTFLHLSIFIPESIGQRAKPSTAWLDIKLDSFIHTHMKSVYEW